MLVRVLVLIAGLTCAVICKPLKNPEIDTQIINAPAHNIEKRFVNPMFNLGSLAADEVTKLRTKRSYDECEKLRLCKLHARSSYNFFAAYELYFVNKENARLWDHHARSNADCENRYGDCYDENK